MTVNLTLKKKLNFILEKRGLIDARAQVGLAMDVSGSTKGLYRSGVMDGVIERLLTVSLRFDDNGSMDMWMFDDHSTHLPEVTEEGFHNFVRDEILSGKNGRIWEGTNYQPPIRDALDYWFTKQVSQPQGFFGRLFGAKEAAVSVPVENKIPSYLMIVTDGANNDPAQCEQELVRAQNEPVYFSFVGVGNSAQFKFIEKMGDKYPNVGFVSVNNIHDISDDDLYESLITEEFATWLKAAVLP